MKKGFYFTVCLVFLVGSKCLSSTNPFYLLDHDTTAGAAPSVIDDTFLGKSEKSQDKENHLAIDTDASAAAVQWKFQEEEAGYHSTIRRVAQSRGDRRKAARSKAALSVVKTIKKAQRTIKPLGKAQYVSESIQTRIKQYMAQKKMTYNKAVGEIGEMYARDFMETQHPIKGLMVTSISNLFTIAGCDISPLIRDSADRGIDDIFVNEKDLSLVTPLTIPIFHESKFSEKCHLSLLDNSASGPQLSAEWLSVNLQKIIDRTNLFIRHPSDLKQAHCAIKLKEIVESFAAQTKANRYFTTLSVLCGNGNLHLYEVFHNTDDDEPSVADVATTAGYGEQTPMEKPSD